MFQFTASHYESFPQQQLDSQTTWHGPVRYNDESIEIRLSLVSTNEAITGSLYVIDPSNKEQINMGSVTGTQNQDMVSLSSAAGYQITGQLSSDSLVGNIIFLPDDGDDGLTAEMILNRVEVIFLPFLSKE